MHRTNIYLTPELERGLDARARRQKKSRSQVIREILERDLAAVAPDEELAGSLGALADAYHARISGMFDDDPDLSIER